jgi:hypothetical protein
MERPGWVTVTGALGALFGLLAILGSGQMLVLPHLLSPEMLKKLLDVPAWFKPMNQVSDAVSFFVGAFVLTASVRFLSCTKKGLSQFHWALAVSTAFHCLKGLTALASLSILGLVSVAGSFFYLVVNTGLYFWVRFHDQKVFTDN